MAQSEALAALRDIHFPAAVGWWPPAPGWWLLLLLGCLGLFALLYSLRRRYIWGRARREALLLLRQYQQQASQGQNHALICARVSELLRRVALAYYPRETVAALQGEAWIDFLNAEADNVDFQAVKSLLLETAYQSQSNASLEPLFQQAGQWIRQRGRPC
ncbi:MAG: DUF4381 domain-containing protein [Legionellaceae bacterium]|nr:DUF4381 domain-containing protein [Legionellaceae bacterium]